MSETAPEAPDPKRRRIKDVITAIVSNGGRVSLVGAKLDISVDAYDGPSELVDELRRRAGEATGYLASLRPKRPLPSARTLAERPRSFPLSAAQRQWSDVDRNPLQEQWLPILWKLDGLLNLDAFQRSFHRLIERHEVLRTRYIRADNQVRQEVLEAKSVTLDLVDLTGLPEAERELEIWRRLRPRYEEPTPLAQGVVKLSLYKLAERRHILGGFIHHIALDASSLGILLGELMARYYGGLFGKETGADDVRQYGDFALWERSWLTEEEQELAARFWEYELAEVEPVSKSSGSLDSFDTVPLVVPGEIYEKILASAKSTGVTLNIFFLTALSIALGAMGNRRQALFGHICHGRPPGFDKVIGSFIQMRPFFLALDEDESFSDLLIRGRRMFALSSDLRRPAPAEILDRLGVGNVVVNYSHRERTERRPEPQQQASKVRAPGGSAGLIRGTFTTTSVRTAHTGTAEAPVPRAPAFFSSPALLATGESLGQPRATGLSITRRSGAGGRTGQPRLFLGLSASMTRLPQRLQTEFHRDLHFGMTQSSRSLGGVITFAERRMDRAKAVHLADQLVRLLDAASRDPAQTVAQLLTELQAS